MVKRLMTAALIAGAFGLSFLANSSLASGPIILGPVPAPKAFIANTLSPVSVQNKALQTYRQVRAFWLSRAIVR